MRLPTLANIDAFRSSVVCLVLLTLSLYTPNTYAAVVDRRGKPAPPAKEIVCAGGRINTIKDHTTRWVMSEDFQHNQAGMWGKHDIGHGRYVEMRNWNWHKWEEGRNHCSRWCMGPAASWGFDAAICYIADQGFHSEFVMYYSPDAEIDCWKYYANCPSPPAYAHAMYGVKPGWHYPPEFVLKALSDRLHVIADNLDVRTLKHGIGETTGKHYTAWFDSADNNFNVLRQWGPGFTGPDPDGYWPGGPVPPPPPPLSAMNRTTDTGGDDERIVPTGRFMDYDVLTALGKSTGTSLSS